MDWNNDGKVDWQDHALFDSQISNGGGGGSSGGGSDMGCMSWVILILFILTVIDIISSIFS